MINASLYPLAPPHVFEIVTGSCNYYVGMDMTGAAPEDLTPPSSDLESQSTVVAKVCFIKCSLFSCRIEYFRRC